MPVFWSIGLTLMQGPLVMFARRSTNIANAVKQPFIRCCSGIAMRHASPGAAHHGSSVAALKYSLILIVAILSAATLTVALSIAGKLTAVPSDLPSLTSRLLD
jgi:hypothetical protein